MLAVQPFGLAAAACDVGQCLQPVDRSAAEPPGGQDVERDILEQAGKARTAHVGDQEDAVTPAVELRGQRMRRHHVAAGAPGSEHEVHVVSLSPLHFTT